MNIKKLVIEAVIWASIIGGAVVVSKLHRGTREMRLESDAIAATRQGEMNAAAFNAEVEKRVMVQDCTEWAKNHGDQQLVKMCSNKTQISDILEHVAAQTYVLKYEP